MPNPVVTITNQSADTLSLYKYHVSPDATLDNKDSLYPTYVSVVDSIAPGAAGTYTPPDDEPEEYLVVVRSKDLMPYTSFATDLFDDTPVTVTADELPKSTDAFLFYQRVKGSPYDPQVLAFNDIILTNTTDLTQQKTLLDAWLVTNKFTFDSRRFFIITYWAENHAMAWAPHGPVVFFCYE